MLHGYFGDFNAIMRSIAASAFSEAHETAA